MYRNGKNFRNDRKTKPTLKMKTLFIFTIFLTFSGCSDKLNYTALSGTYEGEFIYTSPRSKTIAQTRITFSEDNFKAEGNADRTPAGGSGTFVSEKNNFLIFTDKNIWTADFDWNLILNGKYIYEIKNDSLILNRYFDPCVNCSTAASLYQYRLKRIN